LGRRVVPEFDVVDNVAIAVERDQPVLLARYTDGADPLFQMRIQAVHAIAERSNPPTRVLLAGSIAAQNDVVRRLSGL
jgi:hypothetical protein